MCSSTKFSFAVSSLVVFVLKFLKFISTGIVKYFISANSGMSVVLTDTMYYSRPIWAYCSIIVLHVLLWICSFSASRTFVLMMFGPLEWIRFYKIEMILLSMDLPYLFRNTMFVLSLVGSVMISLMKIPKPIPLGQLFRTKLIEVSTSIPSKLMSS